MNLDELFNIKGIAIIGAIQSYFGSKLIENIKNFMPHLLQKGVFLINTEKRKLYGIKCYQSVQKIKGKCSHAFLMVEGEKTIPLFEECADALIRCVVMVGSTDNSRSISSRIAEIAEKKGILILGPGSMGFIDAPQETMLYAGRFPFTTIPKGRVSVVSQSGGLLNEFFRSIYSEKRWGIRKAFCAGEEIQIHTNDIVRYLADDNLTGCIVLLLRKIEDREDFLATIQEVNSKNKPVVVFTAFACGSEKMEAINHHSTPLFDELFITGLKTKTGAFIASSPQEAGEISGAIAPGGIEKAGDIIYQRWKKITGNKIFIISLSRGIGDYVLTKSINYGLEPATLPRRLKENLIRNFSIQFPSNPLDLTGKILSSPENFEKIVEEIHKLNFCDAILIPIHVPSGKSSSDIRNEKWLSAIARIEFQHLRDDFPALIPIQVSIKGPEPVEGNWINACPVIGLENALKLIMWAIQTNKIKKPRDEKKERPEETDFESARSILRGPKRILSEVSSRKVLSHYGIPFERWILAKSPSMAVNFAKNCNGRVNLELAIPPENVYSTKEEIRIENIKGEHSIRKAYIELLMKLKQKEIEKNEKTKFLGVMVEEWNPQKQKFMIETISPCDGSPPVMLLYYKGEYKKSIVLCPSDRNEVISAVSSLKTSSEFSINPVELTDIIIRISYFAYDFRHHIQKTVCSFHQGTDGKVYCVTTSISIGKEISI